MSFEWISLVVGGLVGAVIAVPIVSWLQPISDRVIFKARRRFLREQVSAHPLDGIWLSRYRYTIDEDPHIDRIDEHFLVVRERRGHVGIKSLPREGASQLGLELKVEGAILTGQWREYTPSRREYHGACQFELSPTRDKATGVWTGFARNRGVLSGAWQLSRVEYKVDRAIQRAYSHREGLAWRKPAKP